MDRYRNNFHSGILKCNGELSYHIYLSNDLIQDVFVQMVDEMLQDVNPAASSIIIESDKWVAQYKCVAHFVNLQKIADKYNVPVICCCGITGHEKEKAGHLGSLSKVSFQPEVALMKKLTDV